VFDSETTNLTDTNFRSADLLVAFLFQVRIATTEPIVLIIGMSSGRCLYQRRPERYAREKEDFQRLIDELKRFALKRGYTKNQIAMQLGVSNTCIYQWWAGYSLSAKRRTIERLKRFLSIQ